MYDILKFVYFWIQNIKITGFFVFWGIIANVHYIFKKFIKRHFRNNGLSSFAPYIHQKLKRRKGKIKGGLDKLTSALTPSLGGMSWYGDI
jgi:hypothetical protein